MKVVRSLLAAAAAGSLVALSGCYVPAPAQHTKLVVADSGALNYQGETIDAAAFQQRLEQARASGIKVLVEIQASTHAPMAAVEGAVHAVEAAKAELAYIDARERARSEPKAAGESADL